jgi:hypothetical protein
MKGVLITGNLDEEKRRGFMGKKKNHTLPLTANMMIRN